MDSQWIPRQPRIVDLAFHGRDDKKLYLSQDSQDQSRSRSIHGHHLVQSTTMEHGVRSTVYNNISPSCNGKNLIRVLVDFYCFFLSISLVARLWACSSGHDLPLDHHPVEGDQSMYLLGGNHGRKAPLVTVTKHRVLCSFLILNHLRALVHALSPIYRARGLGLFLSEVTGERQLKRANIEFLSEAPSS